MKAIHRPFVYLDCPFTGDKVGVDKSIAPLIDLIWKAGIETTDSCIRHSHFRKRPGFRFECIPRTWIAFRSSEDAERFMKIVMSRLDPDDEMYKRINGDLGLDFEPEYPYHQGRHWICDVSHTGIYQGDVPRFGVSVWFPLADFPRVLELFKAGVVG